MTYAEARNKGYGLTDIRYQRGYISRKSNLDDAPVLTAGGRRKGQLYILAPCYTSTRYCYRVYLKKEHGMK